MPHSVNRKVASQVMQVVTNAATGRHPCFLTSARRVRSLPAMESALRLLATIAYSGGRRELAAELLGGASLVSPVARPIWSVEADGYGSITAEAVSAAIGTEHFDEHWARGRAVTTDELVASAAQELTRSADGSA